jgi:hypothetical protein
VNSAEELGNLSTKVMDEASQFVSLQGHEYVIDQDLAARKLSAPELSLVTKLISNTNEQINHAFAVKTDDVKVEVSDTIAFIKKEPLSVSYKAKEGVTKVEWFWWGARVYLSKTTVRYISGGISIAGLWIPEPIVSKIIATIGVVSAVAIPGGIVFDVNAALLAIGNLANAFTGASLGISNIHLQ